MTQNTQLSLYGSAIAAALLLSGWQPYDRATWLLEIFPVLIALPVIAMTRQRFPLTPLLLFLICLHALVLIYGGAYSYARVPLGFWMQELLGSARNPYDKVGHFMQGLVPALVAREILVRGSYVTGRKMTAFLCICAVMAVSAWYELIEWAAALAFGQGAEAVLGTQGDPWDTQSDMLWAFIGSTVALVSMSRIHDRQMAKLLPAPRAR